VAGYSGGPQTCSSWRGSSYSAQTRSTGAASSAVMTSVRRSASAATSGGAGEWRLGSRSMDTFTGAEIAPARSTDCVCLQTSHDRAASS